MYYVSVFGGRTKEERQREGGVLIYDLGGGCYKERSGGADVFIGT